MNAPPWLSKAGPNGVAAEKDDIGREVTSKSARKLMLTLGAVKQREELSHSVIALLVKHPIIPPVFGRLFSASCFSIY